MKFYESPEPWEKDHGKLVEYSDTQDTETVFFEDGYKVTFSLFSWEVLEEGF